MGRDGADEAVHDETNEGLTANFIIVLPTEAFLSKHPLILSKINSFEWLSLKF